jgi:hypothetical protein
MWRAAVMAGKVALVDLRKGQARRAQTERTRWAAVAVRAAQAVAHAAAASITQAVRLSSSPPM